MADQHHRGPKYDPNGFQVEDSMLENYASVVDFSHQNEESSHNKTACHPKSYVTMLDEFCCRQKLTPTYQLISMEGMSHEPTFVYKVQVDGFEAATGRGRRKQDARQLAAKNLLQAMSPDVKLDEEMISAGPPSKTSVPINQSIVDPSSAVMSHLAVSFASPKFCTENNVQDKMTAGFSSTATTLQVEPFNTTINQPISASTSQPISAFVDQPIGTLTSQPVNQPISAVNHPLPACRVENPVGSLQELTLAIRWPPPRFDLCLREGAAHDATFTIACYVWSYKSIGRGKSKKLAKRLAAYNMYEMLRTAPEVLELWQKRAELYAAKASNQRRQKTVLIPQRAPAMQDLHKDLYNSSSQSLKTLRQMPIHKIVNDLPDPLGVLQEIATEISFDILFEDLFDLSKPKKNKNSIRNSEEEKFFLEKNSEKNSVEFFESQKIPSSIADKSVNAASLIILTISRQIVCFGTGISKTEARKSAVVNALLYLQTAAAIPGTEFPLQQSQLM